MALFSKAAKTNKKSASKSKVVTGGIKTRSKKKLAFLSLVGVLVLATLGYGGNLLWQKHNYSKLAKEVDANAASIEYKYGRHFQIRDNTRYKRLLVDGYACKWSSNTISVFSVRRGLINYVWYSLYDKDNVFRGASGQIGNWLYNMNITRFSTVSYGHNWMGHNGTLLLGYANTLKYPYYGSGSNGINLGATKTLPACHY